MARRIKIQSGGGSPFVVSVPGVDVYGAEFNDVLFDANQSPLLIYSSGYFRAAFMGAADSGAYAPTAGPTVNSTPSGTFPHFIIASRQPYYDGAYEASTVRTPSVFSSCGGQIGEDRILYATNFARNTVTGRLPSNDYYAYFNYCLFLNYG